jgi:hypothetical protein
MEFNTFKQFDEEKAMGQWFEVYDKLGNLWGEFNCSLIHTDMPRVKQWNLRQSAVRPSKREPSEAEQIANLVKMFLFCSLNEWKVNDKKGKPIAFTKENVTAYFEQSVVRDVVVKELIGYAADILNYQPDAELPEKNLSV